MCAALYCEPDFRDFGNCWFGQRGFGGLLEDFTKRGEGKTQWISQYNLKALWRRDIPPIPVGFVEPIIPARNRKAKFSRLPGHFSYKAPSWSLKNRNLLASKYIENEDDSSGFIRIWTVNERTRRHNLERFDVQVNKCGYLEWNDDLEASTNEWRIEESALELRCSNWNDAPEKDDDASIWIRSTKSLMFKRDEHSDISKVFRNSVQNFDENRTMFGEIGIVDYGGMVWYGDLFAEGLIRLKCETDEEVFENLSWCDHPRMIGLSTKHCVRTVDTRMSENRIACQIFETKNFESRTAEDPKLIFKNAVSRPVIKHFQAIHETANNFIVMTNYAAHLIDDRFPGESIMTIRYAIPDGGHTVLVSDFAKDKANGGKIVSIFVLDQLLTGVSMLQIYNHKSKIWSSVSSLFSLGSPIDFNSTVHREKFNRKQVLEEPTRAISYVERLNDSNDQSFSVLLRQTDDGAIWWQKLMNQEINEETRIDEERKSWSRINEHLNEKEGEEEPVFVEKLDEELRHDLMENRTIIQVEGNLENSLISKCWKLADEAALRVGGMCVEESGREKRLEPNQTINPDFILSKIVLEAWKNTETLLKGFEENEEDE